MEDLPIQIPKILIVDDDRRMVQYVSESLFGYILYLAYDGQKAIELAINIKPDLILLDIRMPGIHGLNVFDELAANPQTATIPVIFMSGTTADKAEIPCLELGAVDYIVKPFTLRHLRARVALQFRLISRYTVAKPVKYATVADVR